MKNPFLLKDEEYTRNINILKNYVNQQTNYISKMTGRDPAEVREWVIKKVKDPVTGMKDPQVKLLSREDSVDRYKKVMPFSEYVDSVERLDYPLMPTFTVYLPARIKESLYSKFINKEIAARKVDKQLMFKAIMAGDKEKAAQANNNQQKRKIKINSLSGAALMPYSINYTASLHPTLTSMCRISTSYANANNEKFMGGNRMYLTEEKTLDAINLLAMVAVKEEIKEVMELHGLEYPTVAQAVECVRASTNLYWSRGSAAPSIEAFLDKLEPYQLANIVYMGDLYHLAKYNPEPIMKFISAFTEIERIPVDNPHDYMSLIDDHTEAFVSYLCADLFKGRQLVKIKNEDPETYAIVGGVCKQVLNQMDKYAKFIGCFIRPKILTPDVNNIQSIERKVVVTSDTDSTIFTTQFWTNFFTGSYNFSTASYNVGYFMTWLSSQMTAHNLTMMSRNIGIEQSKLHRIQMKSEYYFPAYVITPASKHYYAFISAREGNVYEEFELEVKGVNLRTSNLPASVMEPFEEQLRHTLRTIIEKNQLTIEDILSRAFDVESKVRHSLETGSIEYLKSFQIKTPDSYKAGYDAPNYKSHLFWEECFAEECGASPPLPYTSCNISTTLTNKTATAEWIMSIENVAIRDRIISYMKRNQKNVLPTIRVPKMLFINQAIPKEIINAIDLHKTLLGIMGPWYLYLESMGFYLRNPKNTKLITNEYHHVMRRGLQSA